MYDLKLFEYENPMNGNKSNVFDLGSLWSKVLGVLMFFVIFAAGQNIARVVSSKLPIDTQIEPIINKPAAAPATGIAKRVF